MDCNPKNIKVIKKIDSSYVRKSYIVQLKNFNNKLYLMYKISLSRCEFKDCQ